MSRLAASVIPFSSVVGTGVLLQDETGAVTAQLSLLNASTGRTPEEMVAFADHIARAINAGQAERQVTHTKKGTTYDVIASRALFQVSDADDRLPMVEARPIQDGDEVVVYHNEHGTFVRFPDEMVSPRFEEVTQS